MVGVAKLQWTELTRLDVEAREYTAHYLVTDVDPASGEGPTSVILASGLPQPGAVYTNGTEYDSALAAA